MPYQRQIRKGLRGNPHTFDGVGSHTQNTSLSTAQTIAIPDGANALLVQCTGQNVRYTLDGTTPTATVGFVLVANDPPVLLFGASDDVTLRFIQTAASAVLEYLAVRVYG